MTTSRHERPRLHSADLQLTPAIAWMREPLAPTDARALWTAGIPLGLLAVVVWPAMTIMSGLTLALLLTTSTWTSRTPKRGALILAGITAPLAVKLALMPAVPALLQLLH